MQEAIRLFLLLALRCFFLVPRLLLRSRSFLSEVMLGALEFLRISHRLIVLRVQHKRSRSPRVQIIASEVVIHRVGREVAKEVAHILAPLRHWRLPKSTRALVSSGCSVRVRQKRIVVVQWIVSWRPWLRSRRDVKSRLLGYKLFLRILSMWLRHVAWKSVERLAMRWVVARLWVDLAI